LKIIGTSLLSGQCLSLYLPFLVNVCLHCLSTLLIRLPLCLCYFLSECVSVSVSLHPFVRLWLSFYPLVHSNTSLSYCKFICLSVCLPILSSIHPAFRLSIDLSFCPFNIQINGQRDVFSSVCLPPLVPPVFLCIPQSVCSFACFNLPAHLPVC